MMRNTMLCLIALASLAACSSNDPEANAPASDGEQVASENLGPPASAGRSPASDAAPLDADEARAESAPLRDTIPTRFHGKYAQDLAQCDIPSHGLFTIGERTIQFFESTGEVQNVRADGPYAAATLFEQYGDSPGTTYAFYMRLMPDGSLRYRYDDNDRMTWIRCP